MAVSLSAGMDATRRAARHGANTGIAEAARQLIRSLRAPQRRVLADALAACVDIAVLLSECEQPKARIRSEQSTKAPRQARPSSSKASQSSSGKPAAAVPETPEPPPPASSLPVGRRLEYCFEVAGSPGWYAGQLLRDVGDRWADVQFDDGATMCVKLPLEDSTVWRWSLPLPDSLEPAPKRLAKRQRETATVKTSEYVGVCWDINCHKWSVQITHDGTRHVLGYFHDEHEAARAFDTAARRLRGEDAHGGRSGTNWNRLNFPTEGEVRRAVERGAVLTAEDRAAAVAASEQQGPSKFVGVSWTKKNRKWMANIKHNGNQHHLGYFDDEQQAATAFDTAARRVRGDEAHGGTFGAAFGKRFHRHRLNFPTQVEVARAKARGMPN